MTTWWSKSILAGGVAAVLLLPIGALGTRAGLWGFEVGFILLQLGILLALVGLGGGIPGVIAARRRSLSGDLWATVSGMALGFAVVVFLGMQLLKGLSGPLIHHVSTNTEDPPAFIEVVALRGEGANPLEFDAEKIAPLQAEFYPWIEPLLLRATPDEAFDEALYVLMDMGLEVVATHPEEGLIEAVDTTFWFGFKDDVAVRVRAYPQGSVVDARSISRVGLTDMGTNAERVKEIFRRLSGGS